VGQNLFRLKGIPWQGKNEEELITLQPELAEAHRACKASDEHAWNKGLLDISMETVTDIRGDVHHFEVSKVPLFEGNGNRHALIIIGRDISERIIAEESLRLAASVFENSREGFMITTAGRDPSIIRVNQAFLDMSGYAAEDVLGKNPRIFKSGRHDSDFYRNIWQTVSTTGVWRGETWSRRKDGEIFPEWVTITAVKDDRGEVTHLVGIYADITEFKNAQDKLHELVNHDPLTGLPNRRLLNELMDHAIRRAEREHNRIALLFVDLDRFKTINDTLGHQVGDRLLAEVSRRITHVVRESDATARLGGDEFLVMMDFLRDIEDATIVAKKIIAAMNKEFIIDGNVFYIGASIGISVYPDNGTEVEELIKAADIAMYHVKSEGKNNYRFYSPDLSDNANERFTLETHLRRAVERCQFEVYYQPQVSLASGRIIGAEALVRWRHPELGMVSPARFIPLAEEIGSIIQIGELVLREAAHQARQWMEEGYLLQGISVNVSGVQIQRSNFADTVYGVLIETGCEPGMLELEITESTIMRNTEYVIGVFDRIKNMGVRMAIDDFGTGYSSLSHLKRLPLDKLKIDQSFVRDLPEDAHDAAIAMAVQALGHSLGLTVIAEGVETVEQEAFLRQINCDEVQGYLYGRPVPAEAFAELLKADKSKRAQQ
jgi:diguanylate cyclase (GGDEF)-like protein